MGRAIRPRETTTIATDAPHPDSVQTIRTTSLVRPEREAGVSGTTGLRLGTKLFLGAVLLVTATLGIAVAASTWRANQIAERSIREGLKEIPRTVAVYRAGLEAQLRASLHSIADEPGTKGLFDTDPKTIHDWSVAKAETLRARTVFVFDRDGLLVTRSDRPSGEDAGRSFRGARWVADAIETRSEPAAAIREGSVLAIVTAVPVVAGDESRGEGRLVGVIAAAVALDQEKAAALRALTGGTVVFAADVARRTEAPKLALCSSTDPSEGTPLLTVLSGDATALDTLFRKGQEVGPLDLDVNGKTRIVAALPVSSAAGEVLGAVVVSRSREEETAAFRQIRTMLLYVGLAALLISLPVSYTLARKVARPLRQLAESALAVREGNLDVALPEAGGDEVGMLTKAFLAMVGELREKAQLERLLEELRRRPADSAPLSDTQRLTGSGAADGLPSPGPSVGALWAGRYDVREMLGRGGMGSVYRAVDRELDEEVALKVLTPVTFSEGSVAVQTLKQEIRLARKITHPNVVRTHDLGEANGVRFLTMELVPGMTLRKLIDRRRTLALAPGLQIAKQLLRGLGAVHEAGIVHRDVKPQNVMVLPTGVVKLMDFGIARSAGTGGSVDGEGTVGTPFYMSPEQARGLPLDARSDIYSVGVILFEMFVGTKPFDAPNAYDVMRKQISDEPPVPRSLRPDLPETLETLILACLSKDPGRRPPGASDLYGALMRLPV
jgi:eukaryotic-like serine/threonine-protein kinase